MNVIGYVRVSTKEQDEGNQIAEINRFCEKNNYKLIKIVVDKISGAVEFKKRDTYSEIENIINNNNINAIICWSIDRIGRNMLDTLNTILEFESRGIKVISIKEEFLQTLDENLRKLILSIFAWFSEFERKRIRERQILAWQSGKQKGRPKKISDEEISNYFLKYGNKVSILTLLKIINADREKAGKEKISYATLYLKIKKLKLI
ncbi:MAG: recombinase family protein [Nanopusillaceae archaeon]